MMDQEAKYAQQIEEALAASAEPDLTTLAPELQPLVALALKMKEGMAPAGPSKAAVARTRARVLNRIQAKAPAAKRTSQPPSRRSWPFMRRYAVALASLLVVFAVLMSGVGVAYAAEGSLPGDALYPVKTGLETAQLALTFSSEGRGELLRQQADQRLSEIQALIAAGRQQDIGAAASSYAHTLQLLEQTASSENSQGLTQAQESLTHHIQVLQGLLLTAPEPAQQGLQNALQKSQHGIQVLDAIQRGENPSGVAPGQLKKTPSPDDVAPGNGKGNGPQNDHTPGPPGDKTPGPPGGPPGQNKGGSSGDHGNPNGSPPGQGN